MSSKKIPGGVGFTAAMWEAIDEQAELLGYSRTRFVERCVEAIFEMINNPEKRTVPKIVHMSDSVKDSVNFPIRLIDNVTQKRAIKRVKKNFTNDKKA